MDRKYLLGLINHRIGEIEKLSKSLESNDIIHDIDIDLLLNKIRLVYEDVKQLSLIGESPVEKETEIIDYPDQAEEGEEVDTEIVTSSTFAPEPPVVQVEEQIQELVVEEEREPEPEKAVQEEPEPEIEADPMAEAVKDDARSEKKQSLLNEPKENILTGARLQAVEDIMVAIGLNDRFLFTRELFSNDAALFKNTIGILNQQDSWESAVDYLNKNFTWNREDPTLVLFLGFVRRRYIR